MTSHTLREFVAHPLGIERKSKVKIALQIAGNIATGLTIVNLKFILYDLLACCMTYRLFIHFIYLKSGIPKFRYTNVNHCINVPLHALMSSLRLESLGLHA